MNLIIKINETLMRTTAELIFKPCIQLRYEPDDDPTIVLQCVLISLSTCSLAKCRLIESGQ